jgi:hypothetical protein
VNATGGRRDVMSIVSTERLALVVVAAIIFALTLATM